MRKVTKDFLNLFFNKGETICVSDCQGGYHSISQEELEGDIRLVSPKEGKKDRFTREEFVKLVAINPIKGWRRDDNTTAYRTFLVECDDMSLEEQYDYIHNMGFPYSYCCFSGNKSLHFALVLDRDIPSESIYRHTAEWILNILEKADQMTKNPTRSVRFPGVFRQDTGKEQRLVHMKKRISLDELGRWLNKHPHKAPTPMVRRPRNFGKFNMEGVGGWAKDKLMEGVHNLDGSRNQTWMSIGCEFAMNGMSLDETIHHLNRYYEEQPDFKEKEWLDAVKNGWHYADKISAKR
jgi:hypothetical protein